MIKEVKVALREKKAAAIKGLYCITAEESSNGRDNADVVRAMLAGGAKIVQYREKNMPMSYKYRQCQILRRITADSGAILIINDHIDLALSVGADGVHIGQDDLPIEKVREIVGDELLIGLSTHNPQQALDAVARGADYIGAGPIFETNTKKDVIQPVGLSYLDYLCRNISLPFVAIGGIKPSNISLVLEHGAACVAIVTGIVGSHDISILVSELIKKIAMIGEINDDCQRT